MAIKLKPVDVAVIGLGAAGGVAVLPLARAGLKIAGIEAGTWMNPHDFRPDEIHNNIRGLLTSVPKANREIPTVRENPSSPTRRANIHPMMNAIGGTSIHYWAQAGVSRLGNSKPEPKPKNTTVRGRFRHGPPSKIGP